MSYYIGKFKKIDIKGRGSKNYGASNTLALAGKKAGALVFIHDIGKAILAVALADILFKDNVHAGVIAGCATIIGHIFPFYLKFDGGKGYAPFIGMSCALFPIFGPIAFILSIIFAFLVDYIVASTFSMILAVPIFAAVTGDYITSAIISVITVLIFIKHKENMYNLITKNGKEMSIKATLFKKNKKKN
jgi:glycerol-3-phosphate acyltransferase PlsY